jgi:phosphoribosyl 1,2-cyclic phosphodiesterase
MDDNFLVSFWGTRGSIAAPGRSTEKYGGNTSCVSVMAGDQCFIFDAGTGVRPLGVEIMKDFMPEDGKQREVNLFLSHTHWDHIQGLPFFQPAYHPSFKLKIYGTGKKSNMLENVLVGQMESDYFPVPMSAFGSTVSINPLKSQTVTVGDCKISINELDHPGGCLSFKLEYQGKSIVYATDNELNNQFENDGSLKKDNVLGAAYHEFVAGADLLIADGQYTQEEYETKVGWGHTSVPVLLNVAHNAKVKQVAVYHHDPMHTDSFLDELSSSFLHKYQDLEPRMDIFWAREGLTLAI